MFCNDLQLLLTKIALSACVVTRMRSAGIAVVRGSCVAITFMIQIVAHAQWMLAYRIVPSRMGCSNTAHSNAHEDGNTKKQIHTFPQTRVPEV